MLGCSEQQKLTERITPCDTEEEIIKNAMNAIKQENYKSALDIFETYNKTTSITIDYLHALTLVAKAGTFNPIDPDCWKSYTRAGDMLSEIVNRFLNNSNNLDTLQKEVPAAFFELHDYRKGKKQLVTFAALNPRLYGLLGFMSLVDRKYDAACKYFAVARDKISDDDKPKIKSFHDCIKLCGTRAFNTYNAWDAEVRALQHSEQYLLNREKMDKEGLQAQIDMKGLASVTNILIPDEELDDEAYSPHKATLRVTEQQK